MKNIYLLGLFFAVFASCDEEVRPTSEIDDELIRNYLSENNINATKHESGLYYLIEKTGNGKFPTINSNIEIAYKGYDLDGNVFDQNDNMRASLNNMIYGWKIGIPLFDIGAKGTIYIPRNMAYGNEAIIFDIELKNVW